jgi:hypothetical protein
MTGIAGRYLLRVLTVNGLTYNLRRFDVNVPNASPQQEGCRWYCAKPGARWSAIAQTLRATSCTAHYIFNLFKWNRKFRHSRALLLKKQDRLRVAPGPAAVHCF